LTKLKESLIIQKKSSLLLDDDCRQTFYFIFLGKLSFAIGVDLDQKDIVSELTYLIEVSGDLIKFRKELLAETAPC
jgi:hypothetical protein